MRVARQTKQRIQSVLKQETVLRQGGVWAEDHKWAGWTAVCQINSRFCIHPQESHFVGSRLACCNHLVLLCIKSLF